MIGTIRKHSKWLWWVIAALTIISFIGWNVAPASRNNGGGGSSGMGMMYGRPITQQDYLDARSDFFLFYFFRNHEWPDRNSNIKSQELEQQIYLRMMLTKKAESLEIVPTDEAAGKMGAEMLRSLTRDGQLYPMQEFVSRYLAPENLTESDFEHFARNSVAIEQLAQVLGLAGALVTPQEAVAAYQNEHQQVSAQIVFFSASNYLSQVAAAPATVAQFYTNYLTQYQLPDRRQVNYVEFNLTNYLAQSKAEWAKTNFEENVNATFAQYGMSAFPEAKTADDAKAIIREDLIRQRALLLDAKAQANSFAKTVFNMSPVRPENLADAAKQAGLTVHLTEPFSGFTGSGESALPADFIKKAFELSSDEPVAGPVAGPTAFYVMALVKELPSEIPPLDQIRDRVTQDYRMMQATELAQRAGTNFAPALIGQLAAGHNFASTCIAAGLQPVALPLFSLSTEELPALGNRAGLQQVKQALFSTPSGQASGFEPTEDGGFIVYVQSRSPVDSATVSADLPQFMATLRRQRQSEAFDQWWQAEANRQFRNITALQKFAAGAK